MGYANSMTMVWFIGFYLYVVIYMVNVMSYG